MGRHTARGYPGHLGGAASWACPGMAPSTLVAIAHEVERGVALGCGACEAGCQGLWMRACTSCDVRFVVLYARRRAERFLRKPGVEDGGGPSRSAISARASRGPGLQGRLRAPDAWLRGGCCVQGGAGSDRAGSQEQGVGCPGGRAGRGVVLQGGAPAQKLRCSLSCPELPRVLDASETRAAL